MKKNLFLVSLILFIGFPVLASARTVLSSRTDGGFCMPPGCPTKTVKLNVNNNGWGVINEIKMDAHGNVTSRKVLSWIPPETMQKILDAIEKVEKSKLFDVQEDEPLITDIPGTDYKIYKQSNEEITICKKEMGHLWLQSNGQGHSLMKSIEAFSSLSFISHY